MFRSLLEKYQDPNHLIITHKNLPDLLAQNRIQGDGTPEDPFKIVKSEWLPSRISVVGLLFYVLLERMTIEELSIKASRNVEVKECKIMRVNFSYSFDIYIEKSNIQVVTVEKSRGLEFKSNSMTRYCFQVLNKKQRMFPYGNVIESSGILLGYLMIFFIMTLFFLFGGSYIVAMFSFVLIFMTLATFNLLKRTIRLVIFYIRVKKKKNIIIDNTIIN